MEVTVMVAIIGGCAIIISSAIGQIPATIMAWKSKKQSELNTEKLNAVAKKVEIVHENVNSKMSELLEVTKKSAKAEQKLEDNKT